MYSSVLSVAKATMFVDTIFAKFDTDNDGFIDFKVKNLHQLINVILRNLKMPGIYVGNQFWRYRICRGEIKMGFQTL